MPFFFLSFFNVQKHKTIQKASPNQTKKPAAAIIIAVLLLEKPIFIWLLVYFFLCKRDEEVVESFTLFTQTANQNHSHIHSHHICCIYIVSYRNSTLHTHTTTTTTTTAVPWWTKDMSSVCPCRTVNDDTTSKKGKEKEILSGSYGKKKGCWYSGTTVLGLLLVCGSLMMMVDFRILSHWQVARQLAWQAVVISDGNNGKMFQRGFGE